MVKQTYKLRNFSSTTRNFDTNSLIFTINSIFSFTLKLTLFKKHGSYKIYSYLDKYEVTVVKIFEKKKSLITIILNEEFKLIYHTCFFHFALYPLINAYKKN